MADYTKQIENLTAVLKQYRKSTILFGNETKIAELEDLRYRVIWSQVHDFLAKKHTDAAEREIQRLVKEVYINDLPVCRAKIEKLSHYLDIAKRKNNENDIALYYKYLQKWFELDENFRYLVAFRSLEQFALLWEKDLNDKAKVYKYSLDPYNDGGYTGANKPFLFYFNRMVLKKDIKFISKQYPTGYGKCELATTKVRTPQGIKTLADIKVGDFVYSMDNNKLSVQKVLNKWETKKTQVKITTRGGLEIITSPEHRLYTTKGYVQAQDLTVSDYLYRLCSQIKIGKKQDNDELCFATLMLFDGSCISGRLSFTKEQNEIFDKFIATCENLGFKYTILRETKNKARTIKVKHNNGKPDKILEKYGILNCLSKNKKLSSLFLDLPIEQRFDFLVYMFATDGYIPKLTETNKNGSCLGITLASKDLIIGIQQLLNSCGIYSSFTYKKSKCNGNTFDAYSLYIPNEYVKVIVKNCYCYQKQADLIQKTKVLGKSYCNNTNYPKELFENCKEFKRLVNKQFKRNKTFKREIVEKFASKTGLLSNIVYKDFVWEQIKSIEYIDEKVDMVDIEVENTHNFLANDLVSHNSLSDGLAIAWVLGMDKENDVLKVLGNPALVMTTMKTIVGIMTKPFFGKVFPEYAKYFGENSEPMNMFSICRAKEGELTLADSSKPLNLKVISKDTSIDGIRVRFLFIDDICRSKDMANLKQHQTDINNFWNSWWKRNYNTDDFYIVAGGTAYSVNDILSSLIATYSKGKLIQTKEFKYAYTNPNGDCYFIKIPKIDTDFERSTYPQKFSYESAVEMRDRDYATFMAMEQQMPQNPETSPLAWDKILTYDELPTGLSDGAFALLDPARTGKNFVTLGIHRTRKEVDKYNREVERHYLVDCIFKLKVMQDVYDEICEKVQKHHIVKLFIENNTDTSLGNLLRQKLDENGITFCEIKEFYSTENKEDKLREVVYSSEGYFKNQMVYPCRQLFAPASDMGKFMLYLTAYDYNVKLDYDDSIDEECMYIKRFVRQKNEFTKPKIIYR